MREHLTQMASDIDGLCVREQQDLLFHDAIIRAAGNRALNGLVDSLTPLLKSRRLSGPAHTDMDLLMRLHQAIYEARRLAIPNWQRKRCGFICWAWGSIKSPSVPEGSGEMKPMRSKRVGAFPPHRCNWAGN
jgi:hypothetical protein